MATKTSNYEFNKPEQNDFYDVDVQNENWDKVDEELSEFDDSGVTEDIKSFPDFLSKFVTGNKVAITLRNLKAGLQFVLHAGQIVNNCVTDNAGLPLSAAQGKALMDKYTQVYSDSQKMKLENQAEKFRTGSLESDGSLFYSRIFKADGSFYQCTFTEDGLSVWRVDTAGKFNILWRATTKSESTTVSESLSQPPSDYCTFSQWFAIAEKSGNEVTLSFNISGKIKEVSTIFLLKTLPGKYRPKSNKHISYRTQDGYDMAIFIQTDGQIQLFTGGKAVSGFFLRQVITYPAA